MSRSIALLVLALASGCAARPPEPPQAAPPRLTHGAAVGEVSATSAAVWGRCDRPTRLSVQLVGSAAVRGTDVTGEHDCTGVVMLDDLAPATAHHYRVWCGADTGDAVAGEFRTAPAANAAARVRFVWSGDVGGQNVCRDAEDGYFIFERMRARQADFFVALGDMIYADDACRETGLYGNRQIIGPDASEANVASFWEHWRYNRADPASQQFYLSTSYYAVWDDHEIGNDAGPLFDTLRSDPRAHRFAPARAAFVDYQPFAAPGEFYRRVRWGKNVELFILDLRSYRDLNSAPDSGTQHKTLMGAEQRRWFLDALSQSDATWKVVVSSVPISVPTAGDGWSDYHGKRGFHRELVDILTAAQKAHVENMVWITTDIHFATGFRYTPLPGYHFLEFTSGPLNAGMFPKQDLDRSLHPQRLFFYGGPRLDEHPDFAQARPFFNFGEIDVGDDGALTVRIINSEGTIVFGDTYTSNARPRGG